MLQPTNRIFKDIQNDYPFRLHYDVDNGEYALITDKPLKSSDHAEGTTVNGWYLAAHSGVQIKINGKKVIKLFAGSFYNLKEGEKVTHKKYTGFKRFSKV